MIKVETLIEVEATVELTHYNPPKEGSPKFGPPKSYQHIEAPEPEEIEYEVYDEKGRNITDLVSESEDEEIKIKLKDEIDKQRHEARMEGFI